MFSRHFLAPSRALSPTLCSPLLPFRSFHRTHLFDLQCENSKVGETVLTTKHGVDILLDPLLNKGSAWPIEERERLQLRGLVPPRLPISSNDALEMQKKRIMLRYNELSTPLAKYSYLMNLHDRNEVLFFRILADHLEELTPIVYTPTVGAACINFSTLFRRPRGMYFSALDKGWFRSMTFNYPSDDIDVIVVTDGSRILGLGDLGCNGMGIPIGKLSLYTAGAGIHPSKTLPVLIDVGTNNASLLQDPLYLGLQQKRLTGAAYDAIIEEFIQAVKERFRNAIIQFEDFSNENAARILKKYRDRVPSFNDDMQGTGVVALAGILGALRAIQHGKGVREGNTTANIQRVLKDQRIVVAGAGTAGLGVSSAILFAMQAAGLSEAEARQRFWILDDKGLLGAGRSVVNEFQSDWVRQDYPDRLNLLDTISQVKPTVLLGLTGVTSLFTEPAIREMSKHVDRPIIFPLSNPTDKAECKAKEAYTWSEGRCIFASGSPFDPVEYGQKRYKPGQANNFYSFPGIGLGTLVSRARMINDNMLLAAAGALADSVKEKDLDDGRIFPHVREIPNVSREIAFAVAKQAWDDGLSKIPEYPSDEALRSAINDRFWEPKYGSIVRVDSI